MIKRIKEQENKTIKEIIYDIGHQHIGENARFFYTPVE